MIDGDLRRLAAKRKSARERGGTVPAMEPIDALLDERLLATANSDVPHRYTAADLGPLCW